MRKVIKTNEEYEEALLDLHRLLDLDPRPGTPTGDEVELLALLISAHERERFEQLPAPSAVEAIRFRMEQLDLAQKDLVPFIGAASRVSEILAGKRSLTLPMIRALSQGLDIPADVLINDVRDPEDEMPEPSWSSFPIKVMVKRGWIATSADVEDAVRQFVSPVLQYAGSFRRSTHFRGGRNVDKHAILSWLAAVLQHTSLAEVDDAYEPITRDHIREVVKLSWSAQGPLLAREYLAMRGIPVVVEPVLPRMFLDGATIFTPDRPIIGLTIRFDRLDSFWFTLVHELAHIVMHENSGHSLFLDNIEEEARDKLERQADDLAGESLIPKSAWEKSPASKLRSRQAAEHLAKQLQIAPAIVAGRIRREYNDYTVLAELVGQNTVRSLFDDVEWQEV